MKIFLAHPLTNMCILYILLIHSMCEGRELYRAAGLRLTRVGDAAAYRLCGRKAWWYF